MVFHSYAFFYFFITVYIVVLSLGIISELGRRSSINFKINKLFLLGASYFFYGYWDYRFLSLIIISTATAFWAGKKIFHSESSNHKKRYLFIAILVNLIILIFFKYNNFFLNSVNRALESVHLSLSHLNIILPLGISFYTFQAMSYPLDIYFQKIKPTKNFFDLALFIAFFPQLIAGPIVRASYFLPQLIEPKKISEKIFFRAIQIFLLGLFLKVIIADNVGVIIDPIFENPNEYSGLTVWLGVLGFTAQVFCDIAGYTEMAIGMGLLLGYELPVNFKSPYLATDLIDFWQRWHISLSTWFRDYVFLPLQFARLSFFKSSGRASLVRVCFNCMVTMLLIGIWHGPRWTYFLFGFIHGIGMILGYAMNERLGERWTQPGLALKLFKWAFTLLFVIISMVLFRAENLIFVSHIYSKMFSLELGQVGEGIDFFFILSCFAGVILFQLLLYRRGRRQFIFEPGSFAFYFFIMNILLALFVFQNGQDRAFIYFQF